MRIFSTNQVNQMYVASRLRTSTDQPVQAGDIKVASTSDGMLYFKHFGAGGLGRTDLVDVKNIKSVKVTPASKMLTTLKKYTVALKSGVNSGAPVAGQDYLLRMTFNGYIGISPEDSKYEKYGMVHATTGMSASSFYLHLASSIAKNMSREAVQFIKVYVKVEAGTETEITVNSDPEDTTTYNGTYTGVVIKEQVPDWILGLKQTKVMTPEFVCVPITVSNDSVIWGTVTAADNSDAVIKNGKITADLEHFCMGERGDQYRKVGFPDYVPTKYLVDPEKEYDYIQIHYSYIGAGENPQRSEKDLTIVAERVATDNQEGGGNTAAQNYALPGALATSIMSAITAVLESELDAKYVKKVVGTSGNLVAFGSNGAIVDSGKKPSDFSAA